MKRRHTSARSLLWLAMIFLFTGLLVASPAGRFFAIAGAGIMALTSLCLSPPGRRILAGSVALVAILFACTTFGEYRRDLARYRRHAPRAAEAAAPAASETAESPQAAPTP
jgi:hypothetical protein